MRTTKKILASVLAVCVLASSSILTGFAATADDTVGGNTDYSKACETIDKEYTYTGGDLGATYTPAGTTFKVWSPTATKVVLNRYATGSDMETGAKNLGTVKLIKVMDGDRCRRYRQHLLHLHRHRGASQERRASDEGDPGRLLRRHGRQRQALDGL